MPVTIKTAQSVWLVKFLIVQYNTTYFGYTTRKGVYLGLDVEVWSCGRLLRSDSIALAGVLVDSERVLVFENYNKKSNC